MSLPAPLKPSNSATHQRILAAAARVFARDGLEGATTREIAREAGVNEVTLFRHFRTKENLLSAVLKRVLEQQEEMIATQPAPPSCDLRASLTRHVELYEALLKEHLPLIRKVIGETHLHQGHELNVAKAIPLQLKEQLVTTLETARRNGEVRLDVDPVIAGDLLNAMIFTGLLRRASPCPPQEYSREDYLETCVDVFARGIEVPSEP